MPYFLLHCMTALYKANSLIYYIRTFNLSHKFIV